MNIIETTQGLNEYIVILENSIRYTKEKLDESTVNDKNVEGYKRLIADLQRTIEQRKELQRLCKVDNDRAEIANGFCHK